MSSISAYNYEFSTNITIYSLWYGEPKTTSCRFWLRNLSGNSEDEQIEQAKQITRQVVDEIYYLTGFGIDKSMVKAGGTKVDEIIYPDLKPRLDVRFEALLFRFHGPSRYEWVKENQKRRFIKADEVTDGWQSQAVPSMYRDVEYFRLPAIVLREAQNGYMSFFHLGQFLTKKREKSPYGFTVNYDRNDKIFTGFLDRFNEGGNLAFGKKGYFKSERTHIEIVGRFWPKSKAKSEKTPRRSILASHPIDDTDYVYVIRAGRTNLYKIGKSNDPQARLESLQTANPYKLKLIHTFKAENATAAEEELHHLLHTQRMEGEWFKLTPNEKDRLNRISCG